MATQIMHHHGVAGTRTSTGPKGGGFVTKTKTLVKELVTRMGKDRTTGLASEMAFWLFLALIPLAAVCGLVAARFALGDAASGSPLLQSMPPAARDMLTKEMGNVAAWNGGTVAPVSALTFLWLASSGVHSIFDALEVQAKVERPWWKKRAIAIGVCIVLSIGIAALTLLGTGVTWVFKVVGAAVPEALRNFLPGVGTAILRILISAAISFFLVAFLYWAGLPHTHRKHTPIVPGALFVVVLNGLLGVGYGFYVSWAGTGDAYSAGLAIVGVILTALYLFSIALLLGAELNMLLLERKGGLPTPVSGKSA